MANDPTDELFTSTPRGFLARVCLFPRLYTWIVFLAAMDIMFTWIILSLEGREVNLLADRIIRRYGLPGAVGLKFSSATLVIVVCEIIGRRNFRVALKLCEWSVAVMAIPVVVAFYQLCASPKTRPDYWEAEAEIHQPGSPEPPDAADNPVPSVRRRLGPADGPDFVRPRAPGDPADGRAPRDAPASDRPPE